MRPIGFSSGALAKGDFRKGIEMQRPLPATAIELSALRDHELPPLLEALVKLDLRQFSYVSLHAPSKLRDMTEQELLRDLRRIPSHLPIVVHPDLITTIQEWRRFGPQLCLENMDDRKETGRTVAEMNVLFELLPDAGFCFDIGHARQIDPNLGVAFLMLQRFGSRLRQLHVSEVGAFGEHLPVSNLVRGEFRRVVKLVPPEIPVIIESVVTGDEIEDELRRVTELFQPASASR